MMHVFLTDARALADGLFIPSEAVNPVAQANDGIAVNALSLLSQEEKSRFGAYRFRRDALVYLAAHSLLRLCLTVEDPAMKPSDWRFTRGEYGKPALAGRADLEFNLSHSWPYACVVVSKKFCCGIDIEFHNLSIGFYEIAMQAFHPYERELLNGSQDPWPLFWSIWTMKEAVVKAIGTGMSFDFGSFYIDPVNGMAHCEQGQLPVKLFMSHKLAQGATVSFACIDTSENRPDYTFRHMDLKRCLQNVSTNGRH